MKSLLLSLLLAALTPAWSQTPAATTGTAATAPRTDGVPRMASTRRVDPGQMYHRVWARVPMIGTGKAGDPLRPMFAPFGVQATAAHTGIIGFQMQISDDGQWALCEFVGATPNDLASITTSTAPNIKVFERGKATEAEVEADFQQYKKAFTMQLFTTRAQ